MGGVRDGYSNFSFLTSQQPDTHSAVTYAGEAIDRQGYETVTFIHGMKMDVSGTVSGAFCGSVLSGMWLRMQHGNSNAAGAVVYSNCQASHMLFDITVAGQMSGVSDTSWGYMAGMAGTSCGSGPAEGVCFYYGISNSFVSYLESHVWAVGYVGPRRWVRVNLSASAAAEVSAVGFACFAILGLEANWPVNSIKKSGPPAGP